MLIWQIVSDKLKNDVNSEPRWEESIPAMSPTSCEKEKTYTRVYFSLDENHYKLRTLV